MTNFAKFLSINGLKRKDIASFLGVSGAFITQISSGDRPLPEDKLAMIKANAYNWDVSMLTQPENPMTDEPKDGTLDFVIRYMARQIEELQAKFDNLEAEYKEVRQERDDLIERNHELEKILARKGEIARVVTGSSDASAV